MADPTADPTTSTADDPTGGALTDMAPGPGAAADDDGYEIHLCVYADGTYGVRGPMPLDQDQSQSPSPGGAPGGGAEPKGVREQTFDGAGPAIKAVLKIMQANPVSASEQEGFEAGFGAPPTGGMGGRY